MFLGASTGDRALSATVAALKATLKVPKNVMLIKHDPDQ